MVGVEAGQDNGGGRLVAGKNFVRQQGRNPAKPRRYDCHPAITCCLHADMGRNSIRGLSGER